MKDEIENIASKVNNGTGFFGLLFIAFLVLKLTNVINWSWWWVTAPLWMPFAIVFSLIIVVALVIGFIDSFSSK